MWHKGNNDEGYRDTSLAKNYLTNFKFDVK